MFEGKERRQQLIQELRTTHALQSPEQKLQKKEAENIRAKQAEQENRKQEVLVRYLCSVINFCLTT